VSVKVILWKDDRTVSMATMEHSNEKFVVVDRPASFNRFSIEGIRTNGLIVFWFRRPSSEDRKIAIQFINVRDVERGQRLALSSGGIEYKTLDGQQVLVEFLP